MNFWRQTTHIMSYFKEENFRGDKRLPSNFMSGFLEASLSTNMTEPARIDADTLLLGSELKRDFGPPPVYTF